MARTLTEAPGYIAGQPYVSKRSRSRTEQSRSKSKDRRFENVRDQFVNIQRNIDETLRSSSKLHEDIGRQSDDVRPYELERSMKETRPLRMSAGRRGLEKAA